MPVSIYSFPSLVRRGIQTLFLGLLAYLVALLSLLVPACALAQQSSIGVPYTMTTIAGTSPMSSVAGTQCPNLPAGTVSSDAFGDGCLATNAIFGAAARGGVQVDAFGNVFIDDDVNSIVHVIDPTTGIMSVLAGGASSVCPAATGAGASGAMDSSGDGCLAATQTKVSSQRGIGLDAYGNVILAGYGDNAVHMICRTASPLCSSSQIGRMQLIAGCVKNATSGPTGGVGLDNVLAAQTFVTAGCTTANGEVDAPRGVSGDMFGNTYFADTSSSRTRVVVGPLTSTFFSGNNPIYAALGASYPSVTQGYAYTVVNPTGTSTSTGGAARTVGSACSNTENGATYNGTALDAYGDGCPASYSSVAASSGYTSAVAVDAAGNMVFTDPTHGLRVFYVGGAGVATTKMQAAIIANNPGVTPQPGFIYLLWGGGATALGSKPTLGTATAATDTTTVKIAISPQGNFYIGDSSKILSFDINTGFIRTLFTSSANVTGGTYCSGNAGPKSLDSYSDGCPANNSLFSNSSGLGISLDGGNNLFVLDASSTTKMLVRKVLAQGLAQETEGTPLVQDFQVHVSVASTASLGTPTSTLSATPDMSALAPTCGAQNADFSFDCVVQVTATPSGAGQRSATLSVSVPYSPTSGSAGTSVTNIGLGGTASGSALAFDNAASISGTTTAIAPVTSVVVSGITPVGVALDGAGNVYAMDGSGGHFLEYVQGSGTVTISGTPPTNASQISVDQTGNLYAVGSGTSSITELAVVGPPTAAGQAESFASTSVVYTPASGTPAPQAIAVDATGNLFVADLQSSPSNTSIYRISQTPGTPEHQVTIASGFANPVSLALDASGDVYVADKGAGAVYKLIPGIVSGVPGYTKTTVAGLGTIVPVAVAVDPAGDLYVQDMASLSVIEVPVSGPVTVVLVGLSVPTGLAVDGKGNVFSADAGNKDIVQVVRNSVAFNFGIGSTAAPTLTGTLTNVGNQAVTGSNPVTNTTNFNVVGGPTSPCSFSSSILGAQAAGNACTLTANFVGAGSNTVSDVLSYLPAASSIGSVTLTGTLAGTAIATTTMISTVTPANPSYNPTGTEATFTVTVSAVSGTAAPGGTVAVTVDSTTTNPSLVQSGTSGTATMTLTGLTAGNHTISAFYATSGSFTGSNSGAAQTFSIAQDTTTSAWSPAVLSLPYSAPIGASVLNAAATFGGTSVPGVFVYTANGAEVNAATYLPVGSYMLNATFYPTDASDYAGNTITGGTLTVTKATTTASVGATQNVVAADGSGNFTSLQSAINTLPNTGGSIYIKPGTYNGFVTVVKPNVSLYGLGGDPNKVVLTNEDGAFSAPFLAGQGTGNNGSSGDQGSATMVVARGTVSGFTGTPSNFYAENFTIQNTYDTDNVNTTSNALVGGVCTAGQAPQTFAALYNAGIECNSQALAIWITGDQAVLNNIYTTSQQDTIYAGSISASSAYAARQYWFRGKVTGDVDYIFGDAAAVFDRTSIYTAYHGTTATGTETIEAQNQADQTGATPSYLSGYVMNSDVFTSQSSGMTSLYFGRPYGHYSTWIMLNSYIDQVAPTGYIEFSGDVNLPTSTYAEYNNLTYADPSTGSPDANGVIYLGTGGSSGSGVTGIRETTSQDPGTPEASNTIKTSLTHAQAQAYYPLAFLGATVPVSPYNTVTNWNPTAAIATGVNGLVPSTTLPTVTSGSSITLVMRPQTPGLGAITNGTYTIPTGTYTLTDATGGTTVTLASGTLDAAGQAYLTTNSLSPGTHNLTMSYGGDNNFSASSSSSPYVLNVAAANAVVPTVSVQPSPSATYGSPTSVTVTVSASSGTSVPTGQVQLSADNGSNLTGTLLSTGTYAFAVPSLTSGSHRLTVTYNGDGTFAPVTVNSAVVVAKSVLQVAANSITVAAGQAVPAYTAGITGFVNGDTQATSVTGAPSLSTSPTAPSAVGSYPIAASTGTLTSANYTFTFTVGYLTIQSATQAPAVATGDSRTVTEPVIPPVCSTLQAALTMVNDDIPASVDATVTNPDGARIQAAINSCANSNQAVRLSPDGSGHNAYLSGPLNMPSGVTLLVDPGVVVFFSRNVQDYDLVAGTHTCGTVNSNSATSSCLPLININGSSNVGIMGFGKLDGRGGDTLLNAFPTAYAGQSWWGLSAIANSGGSQQNPRFIQLSKASNVTLYKITLRNSPLFHVSSTGGEGVNGFTAWDAKIITPTTARNTDGIDPGNAQNVTVTRSWISDGDDNIAVGSSGTAGSAGASQNISVTHDHLFAGHGESIGSITDAGVSNVLFDSNMLAGNNTVDSNSTGIRIKSANDRGGLVQGVQYSNSCFQNHSTEVQFTPLYDTTPGTLTPNFKNILLQNLSFLTPGTVGLTGANNNGAVNPLSLTLDNVSFASLPASDLTPAPTNVALTYGPGQVSSNFVSDFQPYGGVNGNTLADNRTATALAPPICSFTLLAPELTGPAGLPQTVIAGQIPEAVVILTPAVGGSSYPTGMVTLTDGANSTATVTLPGTGDTVAIALPGLSVGTHTFSATYSGDANYVPTVTGTPYTTVGPYLITVNAGSLASSTTVLSGVPASTSFGTAFTVTAAVSGSSPSGTVSFAVNGVTYATIMIGANGTAQNAFNLPLGTYTLSATYSGDAFNAGSQSISYPLAVGPAVTTTTLATSGATTTLGVPVTLTATVSAAAGVPTGTVTFTYTTAGNSTATNLVSSTLVNGVTAAAVELPIGTDSVTAAYAANGSYSGSASSPPMVITVNPPNIVTLPSGPFPLPVTMTTVAGGSTSTNANTTCAGSLDSFGDGCSGTSIVFNGSSLDLRSVAADPFGNVYLTDANASLVRRISPNGVISNFAGYVSGTACVPSATVTCTPTLVKLNKPRGVSVDALGNVYIGGYSDNKVYKVNVATGLLSLVAGTGTKPAAPTGSNGDGGAATAALLNGPRSVAADGVGNIYIADTTDNKIRVVDATGNIQTVIGTGVASSTGNGGLATAATISNPQGVLVDVNDNVYVADSGSVRVLCVTCQPGSPLYSLLNKVGVASPQNGDIYAIAGGGTAAYAGPALATTITMSPQKLAFDAAGDLYIADGAGVVWFVDTRTAFIRPIAGNTTTNCSAATDSFGDGCPATQAIIGDGGNGIGVGTDTLGNVYIADTLNARIRKVVTGLQSLLTNTSTTATQPLLFHFVAGDTPASTNAFSYGSTEWQLSSPNCTNNADTTTDCLLSSSFTPAGPGLRSTPLLINSSAGNSSAFGLTGTGQSAGATLDPASQLTFGSNLQVDAVTVDHAGNVYVSDGTSKSVLRFAASALAQGASAPFTTLTTLAAPGPVAVDTRGYVFVADTSTGLITQISPSGTTTTLAFKGTALTGLTADALNNLFVADSGTQTVTEINPGTGAQTTLGLGVLSTPAGIAIDPGGNLLVADTGAGALYRFNLQSGARTTVASPTVRPSAVATDAAGNLLVADAASIIAVPASANSAAFTVATITPSSIALDSAGNLYTGSGGGVLEFVRTQGLLKFAAGGSPQTATLLESGNQTLQLTGISQTDAADYSLAAAASTDCTLNGVVPTTINAGGTCVFTATYNPTTFNTTTDAATFAGNFTNTALPTPSSLQLILTGPTAQPAATIALGAFTPAAPVYGQPVSVSATVTGSSITPTGTVIFNVDGKTTTATLVSGVATTTLSGLSVGTHTVSASYTSTDGFMSASTSPVTLSVSKTSPTAALSVSPALVSGAAPQGIPQTFTAVLTGGSSPTGTATFYDGTTPISASIPLINGMVSYTTATLAVGSHSIKAQYSGDSYNTPATSPVLTFTTISSLAPGFTLAGPSNSLLVIPAGSNSSLSFSVSPGTNYGGTVSFSCSGQPATLTCNFSPGSLTFLPNGSPAQSATLTVAAATSAKLQPLFERRGGASLAAILGMPAILFLFITGKRRKYRRGLGALVLFVAASTLTIGVLGCGGRSTATPAPSLYLITVTGTDGTNSHAFSVNVTVTH